MFFFQFFKMKHPIGVSQMMLIISGSDSLSHVMKNNSCKRGSLTSNVVSVLLKDLSETVFREFVLKLVCLVAIITAFFFRNIF